MTTAERGERPRADVRLDVVGLSCPEPITRLQEFVAGRRPGEVIEIVADDGGIQWDLPAWCISNGHAMLRLVEERQGDERVWRAYIRLERSLGRV